MQFAASCNRIGQTRTAIETVCREVYAGMGRAQSDLAFVFASAHHGDADGLPDRVRELVGCRHVIGCTGETIIGGGDEIEQGPALSVWAARLPGVEIASFHVEFERTPDGLLCSGLPAADDLDGPPAAAFLLGDPFTTAVDSLIERLAQEFPGMPLMGGMASAASSPGENRLYWNDRTLSHGAVGVLLGAGAGVRSIVSQGCRPVGATFVVTRAERNVIVELGREPALRRLQEVFDAAGERDQQLLQRGPHVGLAIDELKPQLARGDFLIANVMGADRETGAIAIGNHVRTGQTVQFHVRDAETADEDLRSLLRAVRGGGVKPLAALLFSCNGRGTRMFPKANHDAGLLQELAGPLPLAGLFAQGELGPVGGKNYIHGFTASAALFEAP
jgi:small ligand-binding sensory domain FIST